MDDTYTYQLSLERQQSTGSPAACGKYVVSKGVLGWAEGR